MMQKKSAQEAKQKVQNVTNTGNPTQQPAPAPAPAKRSFRDRKIKGN